MQATRRKPAYHHHLLEACDLLGRPLAVWCPAPPYNAALNELMRCAKLGRSAERWFAQSLPAMDAQGWKFALLTAYLTRGGRIHGLHLPRPALVSLTEARTVAGWLAAQRQAGRPGLLKTNTASGVRVCTAARNAGLNISGSVIRVDSEPLTPARAAIFRSAGCIVWSHYAMSEAGIVGLPCGRPAAVDEIHLVSDKIAMIRRRRTMRGGQGVQANIYTTLLPTTPKLMLNVSVGDYSVLERRSCGCPLEALGYDTHLHTIRSYEKLTSEGMNFLGHDLIRLVEEVLPARFGGGPTDYQVAETEVDGLPKVEVLVSPAVGPVDEAAVVTTIIDFLNAVPGASGAYGERWRDGETLSVARRQPYATGAREVLALHTVVPKREVGEALV